MDICLTTEEYSRYLKIWRILAEKILVLKPKSISEAIRKTPDGVEGISKALKKYDKEMEEKHSSKEKEMDER